MIDPRSWKKLKRNPVAWGAFSCLSILLLAAFLSPAFFAAGAGDPGPLQQAPPSWQHWCGTDLNGRDLLFRILLGLRISFVTGIAGAAISLFIGTAYGLIAGYFGGFLGSSMMRLVDILYSIPRLIFILVLINALNATIQQTASSLGWQSLIPYSRIFILILSLGMIEWLTMARIVRGQVLVIREMTFIAAARSLGQSPMKILLRHILPNLLGVVIVYLTLTIPAVIIDESFLSFLGLGVEAPLASLGTLLSDGAGALNPIHIHWWMLVFPALVMILLLLSLNFLGDALRDATDSKSL